MTAGLHGRGNAIATGWGGHRAVVASSPRRTEPSVARRVVTRRRHAPGVGGASCPHRTEKLLALVVVPAGVVTVIRPAAAPAGTVAVILVGELTVNTAEVP